MYPPERTEAQVQAQQEMDRRRAEATEIARGGWEKIGLPLICCHRRCRRARRCLGDPKNGRYGLLPCVSHYREEMRFLVLGPCGLGAIYDEAERLGIIAPSGAVPGAPDEGTGAAPAQDEGPSRRRERRQPTLLEIMFGSGAALARLRRPKDAWRPPGWTYDPETFERYFDSGDWRDPGRIWRGTEWGANGRRKSDQRGAGAHSPP
jgi:hypothetical protein